MICMVCRNQQHMTQKCILHTQGCNYAGRNEIRVNCPGQCAQSLCVGCVIRWPLGRLTVSTIWLVLLNLPLSALWSGDPCSYCKCLLCDQAYHTQSAFVYCVTSWHCSECKWLLCDQVTPADQVTWQVISLYGLPNPSHPLLGDLLSKCPVWLRWGRLLTLPWTMWPSCAWLSQVTVPCCWTPSMGGWRTCRVKYWGGGRRAWMTVKYQYIVINITQTMVVMWIMTSTEKKKIWRQSHCLVFLDTSSCWLSFPSSQ